MISKNDKIVVLWYYFNFVVMLVSFFSFLLFFLTP